MARAKKKVEPKAQEPAQEEAQVETQPQAELPTINVGDLGAAAQYIDVAFRRGAFQASEAAEVGALFNKLAAFVTAYNTQLEAAKADQAEKTGE